MRRSIPVLAASVAALAAAPAMAGCSDDPHAAVERIFAMADQDGNGALSPAEYAEAGLERYGVSFEATDMDADGETTLTEYLVLFDVHHPPKDEGIEL